MYSNHVGGIYRGGRVLLELAKSCSIPYANLIESSLFCHAGELVKLTNENRLKLLGKPVKHHCDNGRSLLAGKALV